MRRHLVLLSLLLPVAAAAQTPTADVSGRRPPPSASPTPAPGAAGEQGGSAGFYMGSDGEPVQAGGDRWGSSTPPETHVVREGDTLWDICTYYFDDPWRWPEIWSYNPSITNPHWIYPGDLVRLYPEGGAPLTATPSLSPSASPGVVDERPAAIGAGILELRQLAFVDVDDLKVAGTIAGSAEEKLLLTEGDEVFIDYPEGKPPQVGRRFAIYAPTVAVKKGKATLGSYVTLRGEIEILDVKKDKRARGRVTYATDVIERGNRVGALKMQFKQVSPAAAKVDLDGTIVGVFRDEALIGSGKLVVLDLGGKDGVIPGNQLAVVRRGDAYPGETGISTGVGKSDVRFPELAIGSVVVVEPGAHTSIAVVVTSTQDFGVGDHVVLRKPR